MCGGGGGGVQERAHVGLALFSVWALFLLVEQLKATQVALPECEVELESAQQVGMFDVRLRDKVLVSRRAARCRVDVDFVSGGVRSSCFLFCSCVQRS